MLTKMREIVRGGSLRDANRVFSFVLVNFEMPFKYVSAIVK